MMRFIYPFLFLSLLSTFAWASSVVAERPHVLLILVDDLGWSDPACYGHRIHQTPNLDRLSRQGVRFTQAYAAAPICSASRAAVLTGKTPSRLHFEFVTKDEPGSQNLGQRLQSPSYPTNLPLAETTTAELLARSGYRTAYYGKWHLNMHYRDYLGWSPTHGPLQQGFTDGDADFGGHAYSYFKDGDRKPLDLRDGQFPPDSLTDKVIHYLKLKHTQPFFLQWSPYYVHDPVHTRCQWLFKKYRSLLPKDVSDERVAYAAMVETLDHEVGRLLAVLDRTGLAASTLIVFMSDNGGHPEFTGNAPHRGSKWNLYEGGIRVPFIARWPGRVPAGQASKHPIYGCDLLPTFAQLAGADLPTSADCDGVSLLPVLLKPAEELPQRKLVWHFPFYHPEKNFENTPTEIGVNDFRTSQTRPHSAIRLGRYKLLHFYEDDRDELYDLESDPVEADDLAHSQSELARQLREQLFRELTAHGARLPVP